ncbi:MAG: alpha-ribazole phosphatase [Bacteroidetes bacterium]|nr:MAG: alpha-ribazole phosphatase [Bacteroidota bacterium]
MTQEIYLIRHTTPLIEKGICYGQTDLKLAASFEQELQEIKNILPNFDEIPIYSSPLFRCKHLAQFLQKNKDLIYLKDELKEMNFGDWEMKKWAEIDEDLVNNWMQNFIEQPTPNGESYQIVKNRVNIFWNQLLEKSDEKVGIVTHFGVIQSILGILFEMPAAKAFRFELEYGAIIRIKKTGKEHYKIKFLR